MTTADEPSPKAGSFVDLSRRMDALERNHGDLALTVARVEQNQKHAEELNKLRFDSLETAITSLGNKLDTFMARIDGMITGEVETQQAREGRALVAEYQRRMGAAEDRLDSHDILAGQLRLLGRLSVILVSTNVLAIAAAVWAVVRP